MASLFAHGHNFINRLFWLGPLMGGLLPASKYLLAARGKPLAFGQAHYNGFTLGFRNCDATAVKEVLVDEEYSFLRGFLKSCSEPVIIDVGAHIGTFSIWSYCQNTKSKVFMIEADPSSYKILRANVGGIFSEGQYSALNGAAWKNKDTLKFSTTGDSMGHKVSSDGDIEINGITFAEIVHMATKDQQNVDLMKIDIEGAEEAFFDTSDDVLDKVKRIVIELHPKLCKTDTIKEKLRKRYKNIKEISRPLDSKPLLYCTEE